MIIRCAIRPSCGCWAGRRSADVVRADMQRELKRLLHGTQAEQDLLGLVAAAGGGLSAADLAELTGLPVYDDSRRICMPWPGGRSPAAPASGSPAPPRRSTSWATRNSRWPPVAALGQARLEQYRERLHAWAEDYRRRGWPAGTPEYLLRGYFRLLHDAADIPGSSPAPPTRPAMTGCSISPAATPPR